MNWEEKLTELIKDFKKILPICTDEEIYKCCLLFCNQIIVHTQIEYRQIYLSIIKELNERLKK